MGLLSAIKGMFSSKPESIREKYIDPVPEDQMTRPDTMSKFTRAGFNPSRNLEMPQVQDPGFQAEATSKVDMYSQELLRKGGTGVLKTKEAASRSMLEDVMRVENGGNKGMKKTLAGDRFFPFDSAEGEGPDKGNSIMEIGYGIKIKDEWLTDNPKKWPVVDGVPVDVRQGITKEQAMSMTREHLSGSFNAAKEKFPESWVNMTEMEKKYWTDFSYSGGNNAIDKNPLAKKAVKQGKTIEGIVNSLDYIHVNGAPSRGLLNRRVSAYNEAALENSGAPIISEYKFGKEIKVKFAYDFKTDKVSPEFAANIKKNGGWYVVEKGGKEEVSKKVGKNFKFEGNYGRVL